MILTNNKLHVTTDKIDSSTMQIVNAIIADK